MAAKTTSKNPDPNDPYYIPTVPTYVENLGEDNNDSLGDEFFKMLALEDGAENAITDMRTPKMEAKQRRPSRYSTLQPKDANKPAPIPPRRSLMKQPVPPPPPAAKRPSRYSVLRQEQPNANSEKPAVAAPIPPRRSVMKQPAPVPPKPNIEQRRSIFTAGPSTSTQSQAKAVPKQPTFLQPPMRFGNISSAKRPAVPQSPMTSRGRKAAATDVSHAVRGISMTPKGHQKK